MTWWVFTSKDAFDAANSAAFTLLPDDCLVTGEVAPVQITQRWADETQLTDGRWAMPRKPGMTRPAGAVSLSSLDGLLPSSDVAMDLPSI